jgi:hypothetical protein
MGYHEHIWFHQCQEDINSLYHFERIPGNIPGAYVSLESEIIRYIKYHVNPNVKSSVITEKDNTTKFEILLTFDPSPEILIVILSVLGFT